MPPIYINTENDPKDPLFIAKLAGDRAADCEKMTRDTIIKVIEKDSTFTTNKIKNAKGYSIRLEIAKLTTEGRETSCSLNGAILQYPKTDYGTKGTLMVTTRMTGGAKATGRFAAVDCVEVITESLVKKAIPIMRSHMASSR